MLWHKYFNYDTNEKESIIAIWHSSFRESGMRNPHFSLSLSCNNYGNVIDGMWAGYIAEQLTCETISCNVRDYR